MSPAHLVFSPWIPAWTLAALAAAGLALVVASALGRAGAWWRLLPLAVLLVALANPRLAREEGVALRDLALVLVDDSVSMSVGDRPAQSATALAGLLDRLGRLADLDVRVEHYRPPPGRDAGTLLFGALDRALADVPRNRLAGVVMITDGQIHDVPAKPDIGAPLHVLIAGHRDERERRVVIEQAPAFGIVGGSVKLTFRIEDLGHDGDARVTVSRDGGDKKTLLVPLNRSTDLDLSLAHAGANVVELEAEAVPGELTLANNRAAISVSGVRDRLKVLLISGEPHAGERVWRNLLKADPSVDLVHFTILRPPEKEDATPLRELALIAFPVRELFEEKLHGFDLIILDRYRRRAVLPDAYYQNIARYVEGGGALLVAAGPEFGGVDSPYLTDLERILPAQPTGHDAEGPFLPLLTQAGHRHPVTSGLPGADSDPPRWGRWMRVVGSSLSGRGTVLMTGPDGAPLLVLDRVGDGRVAELMTDTAWLWSRGYEGGGPQAELLRRLAHWLMKEPELEEERLSAEIRGASLQVERRSLKEGPRGVTITRPDGTTQALDLADQGDGRAVGRMAAGEDGLWRVSDGEHVTLAASGALAPSEMSELRATQDKVAPAVAATGGGIAWIEDGLPDLRRVEPGSAAAGGGRWFGFRANHAEEITSVRDSPLIPGPLLLFLGLGGLVLAWWREGR